MVKSTYVESFPWLIGSLTHRHDTMHGCTPRRHAERRPKKTQHNHALEFISQDNGPTLRCSGVTAKGKVTVNQVEVDSRTTLLQHSSKDETERTRRRTFRNRDQSLVHGDAQSTSKRTASSNTSCSLLL
jgi:hypothetical protein